MYLRVYFMISPSRSLHPKPRCWKYAMYLTINNNDMLCISLYISLYLTISHCIFLTCRSYTPFTSLKIIRKFKQKRLHYNPKCPKSSSTLSPENHTLSRSSGKKKHPRLNEICRSQIMSHFPRSVVPLWGLVFLVSSLEDQIWWWVR